MRFIRVGNPFELLEDVLGKQYRNKASTAFLRILSLVRGLGADTVAIEDGYECDHLRAEHNLVYGKTHHSSPSHTQRLHFISFGVIEPSAHALQHLEAGAYKGYCVLRPHHARTVLEAFVPPCEAKSPRRHYFPLSCYTHTVECVLPDKKLVRFQVKGFPFHEQDGWCMCCAEVALLGVLKYMHQRYKVRLPAVEEIVAATRDIAGISSEAKSSGLYLPDVVRCLEKFGITATAAYWEVIEFRKSNVT